MGLDVRSRSEIKDSGVISICTVTEADIIQGEYADQEE